MGTPCVDSIPSERRREEAAAQTPKRRVRQHRVRPAEQGRASRTSRCAIGAKVTDIGGGDHEADRPELQAQEADPGAPLTAVPGRTDKTRSTAHRIASSRGLRADVRSILIQGSRSDRRVGRKERVRRGSVAKLSSAAMLPTLMAAITGPMAARALGPGGRGQVAAVVVYSAALPVFLSLGVPIAVAQRAAVEPQRRPELMGAALRFSALMIPLTLVTGLALMWGPLGFIHGLPRLLAGLILATTPFSVLAVACQGLLQAEGALGPLAKIRALPLVLNGVITIGFFATGRLTVSSDLFGTLASGLASFIATIFYVRIRPRGAYPLRPLIAFGLRAFGWGTANMVNARLDQLLMVPFLQSAQLGLYAVSVGIATIPLQLGQALSTRTFGELAVASDQHAEAARYLRLTAIVVGGCCVAVVVPAPIVVPLVFGAAYRGVLTPLVLLMPGTLALGVAWTSSCILTVLGKPSWPSWAEFGGALVTIVGLVLLLRPLGIAGAALVSTVSYIVTYVIHTRFLRKMGITGLIPGPADIRWLRIRLLRALRPFSPSATSMSAP
ncbi:MAG TPA: oligosaccharide flippase family protein [Actinomycetota bacterium]|nr:oligosaccharide flippase family protein [Actinomycetota bacterium]